MRSRLNDARWWILSGLGVGLLPLVLAGVHPLRDVVTAHGGIDTTLQVAYLEHALRHWPGARAFWDLPIFWPSPWATVMMDPMLGPAALLRILWWPAGHWPALDANLVFVATLSSSYWAVAAWARRRGLGAIAAGLAGVVYALGPYAVGHWQHLNQLPSPWLPLALLGWQLLVHGKNPWRAAALCGVAAVLQLLSSVYLFAALALALLWMILTDPPADRRRLAIAGVLLAVVATAVVLWSLPFDHASAEVEGYRRVAADTGPFQARLFDLGFSPQSHLLPWPTHVITRPALYPGLLWSALALLGALSLARTRRRWLVQLVGLAGLGLLLACGRSYPLPGGAELTLPFAWAQDHLHPLQALRDPSRFFVLTHLALALLGAWGAERWLLGRRVGALVLAVALLDLAPGAAEKLRIAPTEQDQEILDWLEKQEEPAVWSFAKLPCVEREETPRDAKATLWAVLSSAPTLGGSTGFVPPAVVRARETLCQAPLLERAAALRAEGARWLVSDRETDTAILGEAIFENDFWKIHALRLDPGDEP